MTNIIINYSITAANRILFTTTAGTTSWTWAYASRATIHDITLRIEATFYWSTCINWKKRKKKELASIEKSNDLHADINRLAMNVMGLWQRWLKELCHIFVSFWKAKTCLCFNWILKIMVWIELRVARMTTQNSGPVSSRRRKNSVLN